MPQLIRVESCLQWLASVLAGKEGRRDILQMSVFFFSGEWGEGAVGRELFLYLLELQSILMPKWNIVGYYILLFFPWNCTMSYCKTSWQLRIRFYYRYLSKVRNKLIVLYVYSTWHSYHTDLVQIVFFHVTYLEVNSINVQRTF